MDIFFAIAEPTRRNILELLAEQGQLAASDIAKRFRSTPSAISQHLKVLREAKLVKMDKKAQQRLYTIDPASMAQVEIWVKYINSNWQQRFDRLDKVLKEDTHGKH